MKTDLESSFRVLGYDLKPFCKDSDQVGFLVKFWKQKFRREHVAQVDDQQLEICSNKLIARFPASTSSKETEFTSIPLASTHEEADTGLVLHVAHCFRRGHHQVIVKTNDTDILAMLIQHFKIMTYKCTASDPELYLKFRDKTFPIHQLVKKIPVAVINTIFFLYCFTDCDTVSFFYSKGKKTYFTAALKPMSWTSWKLTAKVISAPRCLTEFLEDLANIFRNAVIVAYGKRYEEFSSLNYLRVHLFHKKSCLKCLPPTKTTFKYHVKRAAFQWSLMLQASETQPYIHKPLYFGLAYSHANGVFLITKRLLQWSSTFKGVPKSCSCKNEYAERCPCSFDGKCDLLCPCSGSCSIDSDEK
ncbi:hypothetical protein QYM36_003116 [Artemia franciscana]|uniref:Tesmin/TSO1-like CXC domain-containing protein n=1 Tax=Artemia franciscana TaxID=6661 RepID=A0AA88IL17_ARTSF|nr:hypothetical protein QYM36_003116 [Artemia franciscana]